MRMKDNKFFSFFEPVLKYIDTGKFFREPFRWLYAILAILNLLTPIVLLVMAINNDLFRYGGGRMIAAFILVWLVIAFVYSGLARDRLRFLARFSNLVEPPRKSICSCDSA